MASADRRAELLRLLCRHNVIADALPDVDAKARAAAEAELAKIAREINRLNQDDEQ